jgi:hypothetical protein
MADDAMIYAAAGLSGVIFLTGAGLNFAYGSDGKKKDVGKFVMTLATVVLALFNLVHSRTALVLSIIGCIIAFIGTVINVSTGDAQAKMATGDIMVFLGSTLCSISAGMIIGELLTWKWIDNYSAENAARESGNEAPGAPGAPAAESGGGLAPVPMTVENARADEDRQAIELFKAREAANPVTVNIIGQQPLVEPQSGRTGAEEAPGALETAANNAAKAANNAAKAANAAAKAANNKAGMEQLLRAGT